MELAEIFKVVAGGAGGTAAIFIWLYIDERRASRKRTDDLMSFMVKQTEVNINMTNAMNSLTTVVKERA